MKKIIIPIVIVLLVLMVVVAVVFKKEKKTHAFVAKAELGEFKDVVTANGILEPKIKVNIMSEVMGKIDSIPVKEGDFVKKGDILVIINGKDLKSDVDRQKASLEIAQIQVKNQKVALERAENLYRRKKKLYEKNLISIEEYELAEIGLREAKYTLDHYYKNVEQSKAALKKVEELLSKTIIKSPMDGKVTALNKEVGEQVIQGTINIAGSVIMQVSDMSGIDLEVEINEVETSRIKVGMDVSIEIDAIKDKKFKGIVQEIGQSAYKPAGKDVPVFKVKLNLKELDERMKPGMSGRADILVMKKENVLTIPIESVQERDNDKKEKEKYCFKVEKGKAVKTILETGVSNDSQIEVLKGLKKGDKVVTGPYRVFKKMKDGDSIKEKEED